MGGWVVEFMDGWVAGAHWTQRVPGQHTAGARPALVGARPALVGARPALVGARPAHGGCQASTGGLPRAGVTVSSRAWPSTVGPRGCCHHGGPQGTRYSSDVSHGGATAGPRYTCCSNVMHIHAVALQSRPVPRANSCGAACRMSAPHQADPAVHRSDQGTHRTRVSSRQL